MRTMLRGWIVAAAVLIAWRLAGRSFDDLGLGWPPAPLELAAIAFALAAVAVLAWQATFGFRPSEKDIAAWKRQLDALKLAPQCAGAPRFHSGLDHRRRLGRAVLSRLPHVVLRAAGGRCRFDRHHFGHLRRRPRLSGLEGVVRTTIAGALFAAGYALTASLWWLMIIHAAIDVFAGVLAWRVYSMHRDS